MSEDELLQKLHLSMEFEEVTKSEEIAWRQRSRVQWLKQGDKNTIYFHRIAIAHKEFNTIDSLMAEGTLLLIQKASRGYYQFLSELIQRD